MSIAGLPEWIEMLRQQDPTQIFILGNELFKKLTGPQARSLASVFVGAPDNRTKYLAAGLLLLFVRNKDARLAADALVEIGREAQRLARSEYPHTELGARAFALFKNLDPGAAEQFLLSLDPVSFQGDELLYYVSDLEYFHTPATVARLKELEQKGGEAGGRANRALTSLGQLSEAQIKSIAHEFRSNPTTATLNKVFHAYVRFLTGKRVQPARELLGEPGRQEPDCLIYQTEQPYAEMRIWFDHEGNITDVYWR